MTTICFKDGVLAADSKMNAGSAYFGLVRKIFPLGDGSFAVGAGAYQHVVAFVDWIKAGKPEDKKPAIDDNFEGAHVTPEGTTWFDTKLIGYAYEPHRGFWCLGSGSEFAMGAMAAGATAEDACMLACEFDSGSGMPVTSVKVRR